MCYNIIDLVSYPLIVPVEGIVLFHVFLQYGVGKIFRKICRFGRRHKTKTTAYPTSGYAVAYVTLQRWIVDFSYIGSASIQSMMPYTFAARVQRQPVRSRTLAKSMVHLRGA